MVDEVSTARSRRKVREGIVVSDKMEKTVVVLVRGQKPHALYQKVVRQNRRFKAHDEAGECKVGDRVQIMESRPISKEVRWRVSSILEKAK